jgi:hypothetical protein
MPQTAANIANDPLAPGRRARNDALCLWRLCRNAACIRARACRGDPEACLDDHIPLLPAGVQDWLEEIAVLQQDGYTFGEAADALEDTAEGDARQAWRAAVRASMRSAPSLRRRT